MTQDTWGISLSSTEREIYMFFHVLTCFPFPVCCLLIPVLETQIPFSQWKESVKIGKYQFPFGPFRPLFNSRGKTWNTSDFPYPVGSAATPFTVSRQNTCLQWSPVNRSKLISMLISYPLFSWFYCKFDFIMNRFKISLEVYCASKKKNCKHFNLIRFSSKPDETLNRKNSGAPNDGFLANALKRCFRLSGGLLKLCRLILGCAIKFLSVRFF